MHCIQISISKAVPFCDFVIFRYERRAVVNPALCSFNSVLQHEFTVSIAGPGLILWKHFRPFGNFGHLCKS